MFGNHLRRRAGPAAALVIPLVLATSLPSPALAETSTIRVEISSAAQSQPLPLLALELAGPTPPVPYGGPCTGGCTECGSEERIARSVTTDNSHTWLIWVYCQDPWVGITCEDPELLCDEPDEEEEDGELLALSQVVTDAVASGDYGQLGAMALKHPDWLTIVPERSAIQMRGCDEQLVARHWELPEAAITLLTDLVN